MSDAWDPVTGWYVSREQRIADLKRELEALDDKNPDAPTGLHLR